MSLPEADNPQSVTLTLCSLDYSQWAGLHICLNMIRVVNNKNIFFYEYRIEFSDDSSEEYAANLIAENMFAQVNDKGHEHLLLDEIVMNRTTDAALTTENCWISSANGQRRMHPTTERWQLLVCWKDGTSSWIALKDLKDQDCQICCC